MASEIERVDPSTFMFDQRGQWDRLDGEPLDHYDLFTAYRDMGNKRSFTAVAALTGLSRSRIQPISQRNSWASRAEAYDIELARRVIRGLQDQQPEVQKRQLHIADTLMEKLADSIDLIRPEFLNPRDMAPLLDVASKLQRLNVGLTDAKRVEITGKDGGAIQVIGQLDPADRKDFLERALRELQDRTVAEAIDNVIEAEIVSESEDG